MEGRDPSLYAEPSGSRRRSGARPDHRVFAQRSGTTGAGEYGVSRCWGHPRCRPSTSHNRFLWPLRSCGGKHRPGHARSLTFFTSVPCLFVIRRGVSSSQPPRWPPPGHSLAGRAANATSGPSFRRPDPHLSLRVRPRSEPAEAIAMEAPRDSGGRRGQECRASFPRWTSASPSGISWCERQITPQLQSGVAAWG